MLACPSSVSSSSSGSKPCPMSESHMVPLLLRYLLDASPTHDSPAPQEALQTTILRLLSAVVATNPVECRRTLLRVAGDVAPQLLGLLGCPLTQHDEQGPHPEAPTG
jgi:hypothetical protein